MDMYTYVHMCIHAYICIASPHQQCLRVCRASTAGAAGPRPSYIYIYTYIYIHIYTCVCINTALPHQQCLYVCVGRVRLGRLGLHLLRRRPLRGDGHHVARAARAVRQVPATEAAAVPSLPGPAHLAKVMVCLPPQGTPFPNPAADMAHSTHSTQPALR